jgi:hypothetical protein
VLQCVVACAAVVPALHKCSYNLQHQPVLHALPHITHRCILYACVHAAGSKAVLAAGADLGIVFDTDVDRWDIFWQQVVSRGLHAHPACTSCSWCYEGCKHILHKSYVCCKLTMQPAAEAWCTKADTAMLHNVEEQLAGMQVLN